MQASGFRRRARGLGIAAVAIAMAVPAAGAEPTAEAEPVDVTAERLEYVGDGQYLVATGNVKIVQGRESLQADYVQIHMETREVYARGRVVLARADGTVWRGEEMNYNLRTGSSRLGAFHLQSGPYSVYAEGSEAVTPDRIRVLRPAFTPCQPEAREEFQILARSAEIRGRRYATLRHAVLWMGPIPVFYSPWWWKDLESDGRLDFLPGFSSRLGAFLITSYHTPLDPRGAVRTASHLHLYSKRGVGFGQDLTWDDPEGASSGGLRGFAIRDNRPFRDAREEEERGAILTGSGRYRLRLEHRAELSERDRLWLDMSYLSDPWVTKDFFRREYRESPQPENRLVLTHRGEGFAASLLLQPRWNDFYETVTRLPEARLDGDLLELGESGLYYESRSSAGRLERLFPKGADREDFDAWRVDSRHALLYPTRSFGFLNFTPSAAYRATYYSETFGDETVRTNWVFRAGEDGVETLESFEERFRPEAGSDVRHVFELGFESSFKAFRVLDEGPAAWGDGLRHVAEPYLRHLYLPAPNLRPGRLPQFDAVDRIDRYHGVTIGMRNKLQTRRGGEPDPDGAETESAPEAPGPRPPRTVADLVDADVFTTYRIGREEGEGTFGPLGFDVRLRPVPRLRLDFDGAYDWDRSEVTDFNTRLGLAARDGSRVFIEHRYRAGRRNQAGAEVHLFPGRPWSFRTYHRADLDGGRLEEHSYLAARRMRCVELGLGVRHEPAVAEGQSDDIRLWIEFRLLPLPGSGMRIGG